MFGFAVSITHNSVSITHNSKYVGPMEKKKKKTLFGFVSITQFSDFWVMSYGNWKHILGVFSFQNSVSKTQFSFLSFFLHFSFFLSLFFLCSSAQSILSFSFSSFLPFSSQAHKKNFKNFKKINQRLGQRIGCYGFVNFLGASRMLMNFLGLCFKLGIEVVVVGIGGWRGKKKRNAWFWEIVAGSSCTKS